AALFPLPFSSPFRAVSFGSPKPSSPFSSPPLPLFVSTSRSHLLSFTSLGCSGNRFFAGRRGRTPPPDLLLPLSVCNWLVARNCLERSHPGISMGIYLSSPKTEKFSEDGANARLRFGLSSMQGWRATMEDAHAAVPDLDNCTSFFGVYDGHGGKVVAKFCAKYLHAEILKCEPQLGGDLSASVQKAFLRMDEMMKGQRGWRELAVLGDKMDKFTGLIEGLIWSPRGGYSSEHLDEWAYEEGPHSDFSGPTSGSTACVAVIRNNQLIVANAGDSRCVLSRKGQAISLSTDHKPYLVEEKERIVKAGGFIQAGRINGSLNLTRAIGDMEFKQNKFLPAEKQVVTCNPDINIVELCDDDEFLILACDGVWYAFSAPL
ncbi:unnamed protein product, partial [Musa hybrid cultivar]